MCVCEGVCVCVCVKGRKREGGSVCLVYCTMLPGTAVINSLAFYDTCIIYEVTILFLGHPSTIESHCVLDCASFIPQSWNILPFL